MPDPLSPDALSPDALSPDALSPDALSPSDISARLSEIAGWDLVDGRLHRQYTFGNFVEAFGFMARVALIAEKLDHHPDWSNSWNKVTIDIVSHDAGGVTETCFALATQIDKLAP